MTEERKKRLALVASKGSLDEAYSPLILATTAAAMGWEVGIFFTFCGLWLSAALNLASGATIILVAGTAFLISVPFRARRLERNRGLQD